VLQQTPSAAKPLAQLAPVVAACPFFSLHAPVASQVVAPEQVSASSADVTATHAPVPAVHVMQVPLHAPAQQMPSSQTPDAQSPALAHTSPASPCFTSSSAELALATPPTTNTLPFASTVAVCPYRAVAMLAIVVNFPPAK
jgi:hypothetical protein